MMNRQTQENHNDAEGTSQAGQLLSGSFPVGNQAGSGRHSATGNPTLEKRRTWNRGDNINVMECFYLSQPERRGYMKRMHQIWKDRRLFSISDQRIADQVRVIRRNGLLSDLELEEIRNRVLGVALTAEPDCTQEEREDQIEDEIRIETETQEHRNEEQEIPEDYKDIIQRIQELKSNIQTSRVVPYMNKIPRDKIRKETMEVNRAMAYIETMDISETNDLIYAGAHMVLQRLNAATGTRNNREHTEPQWKTRLKKKLEEQRKDLGILNNIRDGNQKPTRKFKYKYRLERKGMNTVIEELKQRVISTAAKIKRYSDRQCQFFENKLFENDQKRFYKKIEGKQQDAVPPPEPDAALEFWSGIWGRQHRHKADAGWIKDIRNDYSAKDQQIDMEIGAVSLKKVLGKLAPWKAPGPDCVQGYWIKNFTSLHSRIVTQLKDTLNKGVPPEWMTRGRTVLIPKDPAKGNVPSNYRPITCLPVMYKVLTAMISDNVYDHLCQNDMIPWEQKGCARLSRGTKDQLVIDKSVMKDCKNRKKNLVMGWIDYKKAYDMVPHSWIRSVLEILRISNNVSRFIEGSMDKWKTVLESGGQQLGEVRIKRGIFQGDSLSPLMFVMAMIPLTLILRKVKPKYTMTNRNTINHLLYMDDLKLYGTNQNDIETLIHTVRIFSDDIGMSFGLDKCATITLKRGKLSGGIPVSLPGGGEIQQLEEEDNYKYLGILEADNIKHNHMKTKIKDEYLRRLKLVLKSKLNSGNMIKAINTWAVSLYRYGAGVIEWTKDELKQIDRKTRKLITMYRGLHPRSDVDRLYVDRNNGGRGLMSVEDTVKYEALSLKRYTETSDIELIRAGGQLVKCDSDASRTEYKMEMKRGRYDGWVDKPMHGQHIRDTKEQAAPETWKWMRRGTLKRETESLIVAAQDQALRTNYRKAKIEKSGGDPKCRLCKERDETVSHLVSECSKIAQTEYKKRHDKVAAAVHWSICKRHGLPHSEKWYDHRAPPVIENTKVKLLWDFNIQTDKVIEARRPDLVLVDKEKKECQIIDIAIPGDTRVWRKEEEKMEKYRELGFELGRLWEVRPKVIPIIVGALGTISNRLISYLAEVGADMSFETIQKSALLGTAQILRKTLQ